MRRTILLLLAIAAAPPLSAEVNRFNFFLPPPSFADGIVVFPGLTGWLDFTHVLNQEASDLFGHDFDTGVRFTFLSSPVLAFTGEARSIFQFMPHPDGAWLFWSRAVMYGLRLAGHIPIGPLLLSGGYDHNCKHDVETYRRTAIHDTIFLHVAAPELSLYETSTGLFGTFGAVVEAEINITPIFQMAEYEPDRGRLGLGFSIVPIAYRGLGTLFVEGHASAIRRALDTRTVVSEEWNWDWQFRGGMEFRSGIGAFRAYYSIERITDPWHDYHPEPAVVSRFGVSFVFGGLGDGD